MKILSCAVVFIAVATSVLSMPKPDGAKNINNLEDAISFEDLDDFLNGQNVGVKNDVSNKLLDTGKKLLNTIITASKKSRKAEQELKDDTKRLLDELIKDIDKTSPLYKEYAEPALKSMLNTNVQLKDQRNKLNEVVFRVKFTLKDLKAIANSIFRGEIADDETINHVVNHQVALMRHLITETEKIIDAAHNVYNSIKETFNQVQLNMHVYKTELQKVLDSAKKDSAKGIYEEQKSLEEYLTKETSSLARLYNNLSTANLNLKLSETIFKKNISFLRKRYIEALVNLENSCQKYLDQEEL